MISVFLLLSVVSPGQQQINDIDSSAIAHFISYVEEMPVCTVSLRKFLGENVKYPDIAKINKTEGRVVVKFIVNEDGYISGCGIKKSLTKECDSEALRVIRIMPVWKPGLQNGKPVKVAFTLPIAFSLDSIAADNTVAKTVDHLPSPGYDIKRHVLQHLHYPNKARKNGIEGSVVVKFIVNEDGRVSDCAVTILYAG